jgi:hypothetical protein
MKNKLLFAAVFWWLGGVAALSAQVYLNPEYGAKSFPQVEITRIEITKKYTIVSFYFDSQDQYQAGGWIALSKNMYIKDATTHKKHYLIKSENIPVLPEKLNFKGNYQRRFKAYFPPINPTTKMVHIIEEATNGFNFYKITLIPMA